MASSELDSLNVRGSSSLSLDERFSQLTQTKAPPITSDPPGMSRPGPAPLVLLLPPGSARLQVATLSVNQLLRMWRWRRWGGRRSNSVWSRLDWLRVAQRCPLSARRGFWSFRNKYRRHSLHHVAFQRRAQWRPLGRRCLGSPLRLQPRGGAVTSAVARGRGYRRAGVPSKKQLDAQLDEYMSTTKSRLDQDLDNYMSLSKSRLDAELDEYMLLAGKSDLCWQ